MQSPPEETHSPPIENFLASALGREPMAREADAVVVLLMMASGSIDIFLTRLIVTNQTFSVIFHLPDYKAISNTMQHQKSH